MQSNYYGGIAPLLGLTLKIFIDIGVGVIDLDYRGELGIISFNFCEDNFEIKMDECIAQPIFEEIKIFDTKEVGALDETRHGRKDYGSTRMQSATESGFQVFVFELINVQNSIDSMQSNQFSSFQEN